MKFQNVVLLLSLFLFFNQGCTPSLYPLYTDDVLVTKKEVPGMWIENNSDSLHLNLVISSDGVPKAKDPEKEIPGIWVFEEKGDKSYSLINYDNKGRVAGFEAHLVKLGEHFYFNFYPDNDLTVKNNVGLFDLFTDKFNDFETLHYYPVNTFAKVIFEENQLSISMFDTEFLHKLLDQNKIRIKHEKTDSGYILTAQPKELQEFILKYGDDDNAFIDPLILNKSV